MAQKPRAKVDRKPDVAPNPLKKWLVRIVVIALLWVVGSYLDSIRVRIPAIDETGSFSETCKATILRVRACEAQRFGALGDRQARE